jgi:hypothetical protein
MKRTGSSRSGGLSAGASTREVLERLAQVLISNGASPSQLSQQFARACRRAIPPPRPSRRAGLTSLDHCHVISHWYRDPRFLDASGAPKALPLAGPGVSLTALVRRVFPRAEPEMVLASLAKLGAVSRSGTRYRPTGRYISLSEQREEGTEWLLMVLRAFISTTAHNMTCLPGERLLARSALNPKFPTSALADIHAQLLKGGAVFLRDVDAMMHREEQRSSREPTTQLGVVLFAFEDPLTTKDSHEDPHGSRPMRISTGGKQRRRAK